MHDEKGTLVATGGTKDCMSNVEKLDDLIDLHWDSKPRREALRFLMVKFL